jgi:hypothetical protein
MELNSSDDRSVACFTPGLVGMFGSTALMNDFFADLDTAFANHVIPEPLKARARNLRTTFIPQIAGINSVSDLAGAVTAEALRTVHCDSPASRGEGVKTILTALITILNEACQIS